MRNQKREANTELSMEDLRSTIEDTLGDTYLSDPKLHFSNKVTRLYRIGWYITYFVPGDIIQRAYYLGNDPKSIKRNFNLWVMNWMVQ
jgi:hypothetical protein